LSLWRNKKGLEKKKIYLQRNGMQQTGGMQLPLGQKKVSSCTCKWTCLSCVRTNGGSQAVNRSGLCKKGGGGENSFAQTKPGQLKKDHEHAEESHKFKRKGKPPRSQKDQGKRGKDRRGGGITGQIKRVKN